MESINYRKSASTYGQRLTSRDEVDQVCSRDSHLSETSNNALSKMHKVLDLLLLLKAVSQVYDCGANRPV